MPKAAFEELLMVYTRLYKISQVYKVNQRRRRQQEQVEVELEKELLSSSQEKQRKFYL